ncbi:WbqC family protein [Comamonas composti]|uniref:WbqC family protein n=1 Tax=Comamonas composti TaxID=408558 RepID=UPI001FE05E23|nr:WbqC family protein [Comamonas composti]
MQPYFFPYIGYFQLLSSVEKFIFLDDVNYIKNGWINRNRILMNDRAKYITVPVMRASSFVKINETKIHDADGWKIKILSQLKQAYRRAPYCREVIALVEEVFQEKSENIANIAKKSVLKVSNYLSLEKIFCLSASEYKNQHLKGEARILDICRQEKACQYINLPGGRGLYSFKVFSDAGILLNFLEKPYEVYAQTGSDFFPGLSILDVLMFNHPSKVVEMLKV